MSVPIEKLLEEHAKRAVTYGVDLAEVGVADTPLNRPFFTLATTNDKMAIDAVVNLPFMKILKDRCMEATEVLDLSKWVAESFIHKDVQDIVYKDVVIGIIREFEKARNKTFSNFKKIAERVISMNEISGFAIPFGNIDYVRIDYETHIFFGKKLKFKSCGIAMNDIAECATMINEIFNENKRTAYIEKKVAEFRKEMEERIHSKKEQIFIKYDADKNEAVCRIGVKFELDKSEYDYTMLERIIKNDPNRREERLCKTFNIPEIKKTEVQCVANTQPIHVTGDTLEKEEELAEAGVEEAQVFDHIDGFEQYGTEFCTEEATILSEI